ncbi:hypothetical protein IMSAGC019_03891 [Lachnospiraceae bacterium]|nr:hypothetical protein IMSAGC019_03891 [Lachnospiraceae bacterium]
MNITFAPEQFLRKQKEIKTYEFRYRKAAEKEKTKKKAGKESRQRQAQWPGKKASYRGGPGAFGSGGRGVLFSF